MTFLSDLSPYSYWPNSTEVALSVGWLESGHDFPTGKVSEEVVRVILRMISENQLTNRTRGWHRCDLCADPPYPITMKLDGEEIALGNAEIRVVGGDGERYAAPTLIAHYISDHSYLPPAQFVDAVLAASDHF